jgi:hypothetical protein
MVSYELKVLVEDEVEEIRKGNHSTYTAHHRSTFFPFLTR